MFKNLAIAALLGNIQAQELQINKSEAVDIVKGFLVGAVEAENLTDIEKCLADVKEVVADGEQAVTDFEKKTPEGYIDAVKDIAAMMKVIKQATTDCADLGDLQKLEKMIKTWNSPMAFVYHVGEDLSINGQEILTEFETAVQDYKDQKYYEFGENIGKAAANTILGPLSEEVHVENTAQDAYDVVRGFLYGAAAAENLDGIEKCIQDVETIVADVKIAVADFEKKDPADVIAGIKELASMMKVVMALKTDCTQVKADWDKIEKMIASWTSPLSFAYHVGKDLLLNGVDIFHEIEDSIDDFKKKDFYDFGVNVGKAAVLTLLGEEESDEKTKFLAFHKDHNDKKHHLEAAGAYFTQGFLYGAKVGKFDTKDLYHCLEREDGARHIFYLAHEEINKYFYARDKEMGVYGLDNLTWAVFDMAMETYEGKDHKKHHRCPMLSCPKMAHWDTYKQIIEVMKNPDTTLRFSKYDHLEFNNQNIDKEGSWMAHSYLDHEYQKFGYLLGSTLAEHSHHHHPHPHGDKEEGKDLFLF